jgi:hypothetical protein
MKSFVCLGDLLRKAYQMCRHVVISAQMSHPKDVHIARLIPKVKTHGDGDEYRLYSLYLSI